MNQSTESRLSITGMGCSACAEKVTRTLRALPGVETADVDHASASAHVRHGPAQSAAALAQAVTEAGYPASPA